MMLAAYPLDIMGETNQGHKEFWKWKRLQAKIPFSHTLMGSIKHITSIHTTNTIRKIRSMFYVMSTCVRPQVMASL